MLHIGRCTLAVTMEFLSNKPLLITDTILRDAHQSQAATRMTTADMLPALEMLDSIGYYSLECWGGATYDACLRFLNEDPWERLRKLRKALPNTKLQMLLRGQNLLGYRPYADDVVDFFVKKAVENGIDIIRCFDALNDLRNMQTAVKATKKYGGTAEIAMSYTESPVHNEDYFVKLAVDIQKMGADVICIKDMANLLLPYKAYSLVKRLKKETDLPIVLHTHNTTGTGDMVLLKAIEAGVDVVDTCLSPLGSGTSQPATESLVATLKGTEYDTGFDLDLLAQLARYTFQTGNFFEPGAYIPGDGSSLHPELGSAITGLAIVSDTTVAPIETVHGRVAFLQLVGLTQPELDAITRDPDTLTGILERMRAEDPELVLDMRRTRSYI